MTPIPDYLKGFFDGPFNKIPTAGAKGLNQCLPTDVPLTDPPMSKPGGKGVLPPPEERTTEKEEQLKQTHKKDVEAAKPPKPKSEAASGPQGYVHGSPRPPHGVQWSPVVDQDGPSGPLANGQGSRHTAIYSKDGMPRVFDQTDPEEDLKALADYASKLDANKLEEKPEKEKSALEKTSLKGEYGTKVESSSKGKETKTKGKAILEYKAFEKKWQVYEKKDEEGVHRQHLRVFGAGVDAKAGAGNLGDGNYGITGGAGANAGILEWENSANGSGMVPATGKAKVKAVSAEAKVEGEASVNYAEGKATLGGELGADVTLLELEVEGEIKVVPARWVDAACQYAPTWTPDHMKKLCEAVKKDDYDYGISLKVGGAVGTGLSAKAKKKLKYANGKAEIDAEAGLKLGVGGKLKAGAGAGLFPRSQ